MFGVNYVTPSDKSTAVFTIISIVSILYHILGHLQPADPDTHSGCNGQIPYNQSTVKIHMEFHTILIPADGLCCLGLYILRFVRSGVRR
jgi:hypothetical protein